ncbi:MAG: alanine--tRNA ligase-related protein, partial [Gammaproteobacteria bacterium]|nr:alanine--tRNA ligase-related protein [Gammaproteobacteria bacterium]
MTEELFREDGYLRECTAEVQRVEGQGVVLERTVFYCMGGGQPGDTGVLIGGDGSKVTVVDTRKDRESGDILHLLGEGDAPPAVGSRITARIDWDRRYRLKR